MSVLKILLFTSNEIHIVFHKKTETVFIVAHPVHRAFTIGIACLQFLSGPATSDDIQFDGSLLISAFTKVLVLYKEYPIEAAFFSHYGISRDALIYPAIGILCATFDHTVFSYDISIPFTTTLQSLYTFPPTLPLLAIVMNIFDIRELSERRSTHMEQLRAMITIMVCRIQHAQLFSKSNYLVAPEQDLNTLICALKLIFRCACDKCTLNVPSLKNLHNFFHYYGTNYATTVYDTFIAPMLKDVRHTGEIIAWYR